MYNGLLSSSVQTFALVVELDAEIGDTNCKLINPYIFNDIDDMKPMSSLPLMPVMPSIPPKIHNLYATSATSGTYPTYAISVT